MHLIPTTTSVGQTQKLRLAQANVDERYPPQSNLPIFLASKKMCRKQNAQTVQLQSPYLGGGCISTTWEVRVVAQYMEGQLVEHAKKTVHFHIIHICCSFRTCKQLLSQKGKNKSCCLSSHRSFSRLLLATQIGIANGLASFDCILTMWFIARPKLV